MKLTVDENEIRAYGDSLLEVANNMDVSVKNATWEMRLPLSEQLMIEDAKREYEMKVLGVDSAEYARYQTISSTSLELEQFYDEEAESLRRMGEYASMPISGPSFDISLSKEEAYKRYLGCDREYGLKVESAVYAAQHKAIMYEKGIREQYSGDLAAQLGKNKEEYEERARKYQAGLEDLNEAVKATCAKLGEKIDTAKMAEMFARYSAQLAAYENAHENEESQGPTFK